MGMVVKNNMSAVRTLNTLNSNTSALQKSLQKVSSGMKINSAQDDASGYAISERMRVRIRSLDQANQNSQNDSSLMKTAEGAVGNTVEILRALKEKAINAANDSNTDEDRQTIQKEINQFIDQIDDNALVQFNGKYLVDGSKNNAFYETKSILLNQSLEIGTRSSSALTDLNNRAGDSLGIQTTDQYQVSWVQNGTVNFTSGRVGTNTISDILNITPEGASKPVSQVAATTSKGLIAAAKDLTEQVDKYIPSMTYDSSAETSYQAVINAFTAAGKGDGDTEFLDNLTDANGNMLFAADAEGNGFGKASGNASITQTGTTFSIAGLNPNQEIYAQNPDYKFEKVINTADQYLDSGYSAEDEALTSTAPGGFTNDLTLSLINDGNKPLAVNPPSTAGGTPGHTTVYGTAECDLSTIAATDAGGNTLKDDEGKAIPLYYYKDSSGYHSDIIVTRKVKYDDTGTAVNFDNSDAVTYKTSSGANLDGEQLYKYNPDYVDPSTLPESGLTDAWDKFGKAVYTPDKTEGIAFGATESGVNDQISGLTISILDQDGNVKKAANAALDQFKQYQRAENKTGDMSLNFHIGSEANVAFKVGLGDMRAQALGLKGSDGTRIDVYTKEHANAAINVIENALTKALDQQTTIGAIEARLEYTSTNLTTSSENVQAAESTIRDADMAKEMTNYTKSNVLLQAAQAMLAQANQNSSAVLSLLQ